MEYTMSRTQLAEWARAKGVEAGRKLAAALAFDAKDPGQLYQLSDPGFLADLTDGFMAGFRGSLLVTAARWAWMANLPLHEQRPAYNDMKHWAYGVLHGVGADTKVDSPKTLPSLDTSVQG